MLKELELLLCMEPDCIRLKKARRLENRRRKIAQDQQIGLMLEERHRIEDQSLLHP